MFLEVHILQNFAPSNLNRDDTGSPKECEFGGYRRARISSQCLKRAIRTTFKDEGLLDEGMLASRTKRLLDVLSERLAQPGRTPDDARAVGVAALRAMGLGFNTDETKTQYLLFLGETEIDRLAALIEQHWDDFAAAAQATTSDAEGAKGRSAKDAKKFARQNNPQLTKAMQSVLDGGRAADLALFGRMLADLPDRNIDAACQVAHALSTNKVSIEFDFYTAVDDRKPDDTAGADMLGTIEFNSACFYRYANVDLDTLAGNLQGDGDLARETIRAFLRASVLAVPTGKQNSMAAQNPPSLVMAVLRDRGLWSLANAFVRPVSPEPDLVTNSIKRLDSYWSDLTGMYGDVQLRGVWVASLGDAPLERLENHRVRTVDTLISQAVAAVFPAAHEQ